MVGRPGLNPGTLGLKGSSRTLRGDALVSNVVCFQGIVLSSVGLVSWCCGNMRPVVRPPLATSSHWAGGRFSHRRTRKASSSKRVVERQAGLLELRDNEHLS